MEKNSGLRRTLLCLLVVGLSAPFGVQAQPLQVAPEPEEGPPRVLPVEPVPDSLLQARLRAVFARVDDFEDVQVDVEEGVVHLSGTVVQAQAGERAAELASRFQGVLYVDNDIQTTADVETRITPAIQRVQDYLNQLVAFLPVIAVAFLVVLIFWLLSHLLGRWDAPARRLGVSPLIWSLVRRVLRAVIMMIGLLLAFDLLGVSALVGAVLGTAGVLGLAIGFAFQDIIENYLAGALMSIRQPFSVNDLVRVGEHEGRVVRLTSRELVLLSLEGNHVQLPNATVFKSTLINYTRNPRRLFHFDVGVDVNEDLVQAMEVGVGVLDKMKGVMEEPPPFARIQVLGESSVTVRFHGWVDQRQADFLKVRSEAIRLVKGALDEAGVVMPEPIYQVRLRQALEAEPQTPAPARPGGRPPAAEQAEAVDVEPDGRLDAQVQEDLTVSDEENLLD